MCLQLCQGALALSARPQVMPAVIIRPHYLLVLHGLKESAVLCYLVTQMNHFTDKRSTQNQCPEQEPEAPPAPAAALALSPEYSKTLRLH